LTHRAFYTPYTAYTAYTALLALLVERLTSGR
jgi:hypothetical protein